MKRLRITLRNDFHGTSACAVVQIDHRGDAILSPRQVQRISHALCGLTGCKCSGALGIRGPQEGGWVVDGPLSDGGLRLSRS